MRMINQAIQVILRVASKKNAALYDDATQDIDNSLATYFGFRLDVLRSMSTEELLHLIRQKELNEPQLLAVLGELLKMDGEIAIERGLQQQGQTVLLRALTVFLISVEHETDVLPISTLHKLEQTITITRNWPKDTEIIRLLIVYLERQGRFAEAEDFLFEGLENPGSDRHIVQHGEAFYQRLLALPDHQLTNGNLPRSEVKEGLGELKQRFASR